MMTVINLEENGQNIGYRVMCKGASEIVCGRWDLFVEDAISLKHSLILSYEIQLRK